MERAEGMELLTQHVVSEKQLTHLLDTEKVMRALAQHFGEDEELWGLTGLLHDIDYGYTITDPFSHGLVAEEILQPYDLPDELIYAIKAHNQVADEPRLSLLDKALFAVDPATAFLRHCLLEEGGADLGGEELVNRFNKKSFAVGVNRIQISTCREFDLPLELFLSIGLEAMSK